MLLFGNLFGSNQNLFYLSNNYVSSQQFFYQLAFTVLWLNKIRRFTAMLCWSAHRIIKYRVPHFDFPLLSPHFSSISTAKEEHMHLSAPISASMIKQIAGDTVNQFSVEN